MGIFRRQHTGTADGEVIDLRDAPSTKGRAIWGKPSRCPACAAPGYLDHIDLTRRRMYQHCPTCGERWETAEADTVEV